MAYDASKFKKVESSLSPGESVIAGAPAFPPGGFKRQTAGGAFGAIGAVVAGAGKSDAGSFKLPQRFVLGLTNKRILICKSDALLGRPKEILFDLPLTNVTTAELVSGGKITQHARFVTRDGQELEVEVAKGKGKQFLNELVTQAQALIA
jgi:hypothetical protein